jgi:nitrile hydratase subunit beta
MDGIHDLGGKTGFSRLNYSAEEAVFKARWEAAVFTLVQAIGRAGVYTNIDQFRHAVERIDPEAYLNHGYYGRWLGAIETLLVEARVLTTDEITQQALALGARDTDLIAAQPSHDQSSVSGYAADSSGTTENALFGVADRVHTAEHGPLGHTRLPAYARGKLGVITACQGLWPYPDLRAHGDAQSRQHLYTVTFSSAALGFEEVFELNLDLFEPYLSPVEDLI